ncbi:MAG: hypothetical protein A2W91_19785 [Bacteroidetes bacterium GWF2_38_335]|nr:MAG: hypothetical protein A2W91_19785 [Bacteroidetes bacterium GWF2_38_335]OFY79268.1 MAG: hypothetical protein A2281_15870 [Bacteroidetes bacterium RIFOXYA12_FULL_38_20]HBS86459.1 hypothetical protein [Bacteroidales bacterium]
MKIKAILFLILIAATAVTCNKNGEVEFTDFPIVESYLVPGQFLKVKVSRQLPFDENAEYSPDDIDSLSITVTSGSYSSVLSPIGNGEYIDSSLVVYENIHYEITFDYNGKNVYAYTIVPSKPINFSQSATTIEIQKMDTTSGPPIGFEMPDPVQLTWDNYDGSYYIVIVENIESSPEPVQDLGEDDDRPDFVFRKEPNNSSGTEISSMDFQYYGTHRLILFHVLSDYAALYDDNSSNSQNLSNPSTCIENGYGIFTGLNADTLYIEVVEP